MIEDEMRDEFLRNERLLARCRVDPDVADRIRNVWENCYRRKRASFLECLNCPECDVSRRSRYSVRHWEWLKTNYCRT